MVDLELPERSRPQHAAVPAALLAALWLAMLTLGAGPVDGLVLANIYLADQAGLAGVARAITFLGNGEVLILIAVAAALWLLWRRHAHLGLMVIAVTLVGRALVSAQKYTIGRIRPDETGHLVSVYNPSFPSGHAANSMIVFLTIAIVFTADSRWRRPMAALALALALLIGLSRVALGVHWPSDVVGGWSFGLLWVLLALPLSERLFKRRT